MTSDYASRQRYDQAKADLRKAEAKLPRAGGAGRRQKPGRRIAVAAPGGASAAVAGARQSGAGAERSRQHEIRAPVSGVVGNRAGQVGQYVKPGTELLSLVPLPRVYVTANFKETQLTRMRPGQPAKVAVDAYPDHPLDGRIESFAPASGAQFSLLPPENATGNYTKIVQRVPVRIALPQDEALAPCCGPACRSWSRSTPAAGSDLAGGGIVGAAEARPAAADTAALP